MCIGRCLAAPLASTYWKQNSRRYPTYSKSKSTVTGENEKWVFYVTEKTKWTFWPTQYLTPATFSFFICKISDNIYFTGFTEELNETADLKAQSRYLINSSAGVGDVCRQQSSRVNILNIDRIYEVSQNGEGSLIFQTAFTSVMVAQLTPKT